MKIRPATEADFLSYIGSPPPYRVQAFVGEVDGRIVGMAGLAFPPGQPPIAWADLTEDARRHAKTLHKTVRDFFAALPPQRVVASAANDIEASRRWLERLGFHHTGLPSPTGELYVYDPHHHTHRHRDAS